MTEKLIAMAVLTLLFGSLLFAGVTITLPKDDPEMRDLIECWQGSGEKKLWRSLTDGQVEITEGGVILYSNHGNERALINMECRVTFDVAELY